MEDPASAGEMRAFEEMIGAIEHKMARSVWRIVRNEHDFDEAFQRALSTIWKRFSHVRRHAHPHALALRICIHAACDVLRENSRRENREAAQPVAWEVSDPMRNGSQELIARELHEEILAAIAQLPDQQREIVLLTFVQELSYPEIATAMDCTETAVRQQICRARERLSGRLAHLLPQTRKEITP